MQPPNHKIQRVWATAARGLRLERLSHLPSVSQHYHSPQLLARTLFGAVEAARLVHGGAQGVLGPCLALAQARAHQALAPGALGSGPFAGRWVRGWSWTFHQVPKS